MDPVAHILAGSSIARAGFQRYLPEKRAALIAIVAANAPDIDMVELLWASREQFVYHHRGITHSILGWFLASIFITWAFRRVWRDLEFRPLFILVALAYGSHLCMDLLTPWGTRVLAPFSAEPFSLNTTFIWDPGFWLILGAPWLFRRWIPEIRCFRLAWGLIALFVLMCFLSQQVASVSLRHMLKRNQIVAEKSAVYPDLLAPVFWNVVAQDKTHSYQAFFALPYGAEDFRLARPHNMGHPAVQVLKEAYKSDYFMWARFPEATIIEEAHGALRIEIRDLRFARRFASSEVGGFVFTRRLREIEGTWQELE